MRVFLWFCCLYEAIFLKFLFYKTIGIFYGLEMMTANDEFWLFDYPINPINVPSYLVFKRTKISPEQFMENLYRRLGRGNRCSVRHKKILGKYYLELLNDQEYE